MVILIAVIHSIVIILRKEEYLLLLLFKGFQSIFSCTEFCGIFASTYLHGI